MTWILVVLVIVSGFVKGINIETVGGFQSKEACETAAIQIKESYNRKLTMFCVPTEIQTNEDT